MLHDIPPIVLFENYEEDPDDMEEYKLSVPPSSKISKDITKAPGDPLTLSSTDKSPGEGPMA